jgi:hypothetical protein
MNIAGGDIYGYFYNHYTENSKLKHSKRYYCLHKFTELRRCPSCNAYKTPKKFSCQHFGTYCFSCSNKLNITIYKSEQFIKDNENKAGLKIAIRKMLRMLAELDNSVGNASDLTDEVLIESKVHISMMSPNDDIRIITSSINAGRYRFFDGRIKDAFRIFRRSTKDNPLPCIVSSGRIRFHC